MCEVTGYAHDTIPFRIYSEAVNLRKGGYGVDAMLANQLTKRGLETAEDIVPERGSEWHEMWKIWLERCHETDSVHTTTEEPTRKTHTAVEAFTTHLSTSHYTDDVDEFDEYRHDSYIYTEPDASIAVAWFNILKRAGVKAGDDTPLPEVSDILHTRGILAKRPCKLDECDAIPMTGWSRVLPLDLDTLHSEGIISEEVLP